MTKEVIQIQLAWFFPVDYTGNFEKVSLKLKSKLGESKITQHIPVPIDAPSEIPRLMLGYDKFNIKMSKNRIDLFSKDLESIRDTIPKISEIILIDFGLAVGRVGFVKNFFAEGNIENLKKLLPEEKIGSLDLKEINIRINLKKTIAGYECNNIENLAVGFAIKKDPKENKEIKKEGLIIVRDINTLSEKLKVNVFNKEIICLLYTSPSPRDLSTSRMPSSA